MYGWSTQFLTMYYLQSADSFYHYLLHVNSGILINPSHSVVIYVKCACAKWHKCIPEMLHLTQLSETMIFPICFKPNSMTFFGTFGTLIDFWLNNSQIRCRTPEKYANTIDNFYKQTQACIENCVINLSFYLSGIGQCHQDKRLCNCI